MGIRSKMAAARKSRGLTQSALAELVGVAQCTISKLEAGTHVPGGDTLASLCDALGLSPHQLLSLEEDEEDHAHEAA